MEFLDIVNENDEVIGSSPIDLVYKDKLRHRIVHVFVFNTEGKIGLQQRSATESFMPLHWGTSVGGHVLQGETYEEAAYREAKEELGIQPAALTLIGSTQYMTPTGVPKMITTFKTTHNGPFLLDPSEGDQFRFFSFEDLKQELENDMPCMGELTHLLSHHFSAHL